MIFSHHQFLTLILSVDIDKDDYRFLSIRRSSRCSRLSGRQFVRSRRFLVLNKQQTGIVFDSRVHRASSVSSFDGLTEIHLPVHISLDTETDEFSRASSAGQQADGINDDGLPCSGLPVRTVIPSLKSKMKVFYDCKILDP
ncbi:MAG: hypothetical protein U5K84_07320 [Alkalibacterium sp.]|nr:hypothetical protein [Alkalibacterium sp.]